VYQVFLQAGYVVIAMELADGSLMDVLDVCLTDYDAPVAPDLACHYLSDAAQALDFLNQRRHVLDGRRVSFQHCDIKPSNLLVCGETVKVADYGLASALTNAIEPHSRAGTLEFAAPEVYRGQLSDQTDQYALAVTYCLLRSGQLPFTDSPHRFTTTYNRGQPDLSMLTEAERPIIAKAFSVAPVNRWPTCGEMMAHLQSLFPVNVG
jgi:serine/threonine-protein kinase